MPESKRINRKSKKRKAKIILTISIVLLVLIFGGLAYFKLTSKIPFVSPLPASYKINASNEADKSKLALESQLRAKKISFTKVTRASDFFIVQLENKSTVIISRNKDTAPQLASLQFILTRLTMEGKAFRELDLRFDKPVIKLR